MISTPSTFPSPLSRYSPPPPPASQSVHPMPSPLSKNSEMNNGMTTSVSQKHHEQEEIVLKAAHHLESNNDASAACLPASFPSLSSQKTSTKKNLLVNTQNLKIFAPPQSGMAKLSQQIVSTGSTQQEDSRSTPPNVPSLPNMLNSHETPLESTSTYLKSTGSTPRSSPSQNLFCSNSLFQSIQKKSLARVIGKQKTQPDSPYPSEFLDVTPAPSSRRREVRASGSTMHPIATETEPRTLSECTLENGESSSARRESTNSPELLNSHQDASSHHQLHTSAISSTLLSHQHHLNHTKFFDSSRLFWFGSEDSSHVKYIIHRFAETYINQQRCANSRAPMLYVGKIKRIIIEDLGAHIRSFDEIEVYMEDDLPLGTQFTKREIIFSLTEWNEDGMPIMDKSRRITNHHQMWQFRNQIDFPHREDISYLYSLPLYRQSNEYNFHSSKQSYQVTYNGSYHQLLSDCSQISELSKRRKRKRQQQRRKVDICDHEQSDEEHQHSEQNSIVHEPGCIAYTQQQSDESQSSSSTSTEQQQDEEDCVTPPTTAHIRAQFLTCTCSARQNSSIVNFDELSPTEKLKSLSPPLPSTDEDDFAEEEITLQIEEEEEDGTSFDPSEIQMQNARILEDLNHSPLFMSQFDHFGCPAHYEATSDDDSDEETDDDDEESDDDEDDDDEDSDDDEEEEDEEAITHQEHCCLPSLSTVDINSTIDSVSPL